LETVIEEINGPNIVTHTGEYFDLYHICYDKKFDAQGRIIFCGGLNSFASFEDIEDKPWTLFEAQAKYLQATDWPVNANTYFFLNDN